MQETHVQVSLNSLGDSLSSQEPILSEKYVPQAMPTMLTTLDMTTTFVAAIFYISNTATAVAAGPAAFTYWLVCGVAFFLPCLIATAQLGVLFPYEGSLYNWTHRALGGFWSFFTGFCAWFPGILAMVSGFGTAVTYFQDFKTGWLVEPWQQGLVILVLIVLSTVLAVQRFRIVQNTLNLVMGLVLLAVLIVGLAGVVWLLQGHGSATSFQHPADWSIVPGNYFLFGFLIQSYLGTEVSLNMAGEMSRNNPQRIVKRHLAWGGLLVVGAYLITTFTVLIVRGVAAASDPFSFVTIVDQVLGKTFGDITAACLLSFFVVAPIIYNYAFARLLLVASIDGRLPVGLAKLNRNRVPANAIIMQSIIAAVFTALVYFLVPYIAGLGQAAALSTEMFNISLAALSLVWLVSIPFFFIDIFVLYFRDRQAFNKHRIVPMWVLWVSGIVGTISCLLAIVDTVVNSWIPDQVSNTSWWYIVGGLTLACLVIAMIGSMLASSEASWQQWRTGTDGSTNN
jgi:glutamate:GABA antiporter